MFVAHSRSAGHARSRGGDGECLEDDDARLA